MKKAILPSLALAVVFSASAFAQTTIGGITVPAEDQQLLIEHCTALLKDDSAATHTDPANVGEGTVTGSTDFSQITASDCRDAGFIDPDSDEEGDDSSS